MRNTGKPFRGGLRRIASGAAVMLGLMLATGAAQAGPAEDKLMACMRANIPPTLRIQEFELTSVDRTGGTRVLKGRVYAKLEDNLLRAMLRLTSPTDVNGAAYLMREGEKNDEMYVYLPALARTRRITGAAADSALFGTDLSYADIKQVQNAFTGAAPVIESRDKVEGRPAYVVSVLPAQAAGARYSRVRAWVEEASCLAVKVEFMEGDTVRKRLVAPISSITKYEQYWYFGEARMSDLKLGTSTTLKITGVKSGEDVAQRYFDTRNFYVGG